MIAAVTHAGYLAVGWLGAVGVVGLYAAVILRRGRRLSQRLRPQDRRWS